MTHKINKLVFGAGIIAMLAMIGTSLVSASQVTGNLSSGSSSGSSVSGTAGSISGTVSGGSVVTSNVNTGGGGNGPIAGSLVISGSVGGGSGGGSGQIIGSVGSGNEGTMLFSNSPTISLVSTNVVENGNAPQLTSDELAITNTPQVALNNQVPNQNTNQLAAVISSGIYPSPWYWWVIVVLLLAVLGYYQYIRYRERQRKKVFISR